MIKALQRLLHRVFLHLEGGAEAVFGNRHNPFLHLGSLAWWSFWLATATGIYLYIFFETSLTGAYSSVERLTHEQWYLGGVLRSLHRYGSDAMVVLTVLHLVREFAFDHYHSMRWFAWVSGIPLIWMLAVAGVGGYWLVWDELAQYTVIASAEWVDWIGIFSEPIANNFLTTGALSSRFFSLLVFVHIFAPVFLMLGMWVHLLRVARAETNPPRRLGLSFVGLLLALALFSPALSHPPANLSRVVAEVGLDWFFMALYPIFDQVGAGPLWVLTLGGTLLLTALPWLRRANKPPVAEVVLDKCNGCARCFDDCPFGAVVMAPRSDGLAFLKEAVVNPDLCSGCGICAGACPTTTPFRRQGSLDCGIQMPNLLLGELRRRIGDGLKGLSKGPRLLVVGCEHGVDLSGIAAEDTATLTLPCTAMLAPSFIDYALERAGADGVVLTGCRDGECFHRLGVRWTEERVARLREPALRARVPRQRLRLIWASPVESGKLAAALGAFRKELCP